MPEPKRNMGASVRARLLNLARERGQPNDLLLTRYALSACFTASAPPAIASVSSSRVRC
jgi:hypothetical protein